MTQAKDWFRCLRKKNTLKPNVLTEEGKKKKKNISKPKVLARVSRNGR